MIVCNRCKSVNVTHSLVCEKDCNLSVDLCESCVLAFHEFLDSPANSLRQKHPIDSLPARLRNSLERNGIHTLEDMAALGKSGLRRFRNVGERSLIDAECAMKSSGIWWGAK